MKILFYDIDGVVNNMGVSNKKGYPTTGAKSGTYVNFEDDVDKFRVKLLAQIVQQTGCKLVCISSIRHKTTGHYLISALYKAFDEYGLTVFDATPKLGERREEVKVWLESHDDIESFVILDDEDFGWQELSPFWIETDGDNGVSEDDVKLAVKILNKGDIE